MKTMKVLFLFLIVLFLLDVALGRDYNYFNPLVDSWYTIQPWELEFCQEWGGTQESKSGVTKSKAIYLSQTTLSLQGRKQVYEVEGFNQTLYTASWYLEPLSDMDYKVELKGGTSEPYTLEEGTAKYTSPAIGYYSDYNDEGYTMVKMTYDGEFIKVRIVDIG